MENKTENTEIKITPAMKKNAEKQILELQSKVDYDIRDFPIQFIVDKFKDETYFVPDYQRNFVWSEDAKTRLIESILLGLPIPLVFLSETEDGRLEIVDGVQRISTIAAFLGNKLELTSLKKLDSINGFKFKDLPPAQQRKLESKSLRIIVMQTNTSEEIRKELFNRLNTSGLRALDSEVRRGTYSGEFMNMIESFANDPNLEEIAPIGKRSIERGGYVEFVLRFFAYSENYMNFKHSVSGFIDEYIISKMDDFDMYEMSIKYTKMIDFAMKYFPYGFRKTGSGNITPRVRFEALAVGISLALELNPNLKPKDVLPWLESEEFKRLTTSDASNSRTKLKARVEYVRDSLLNMERAENQ
ncbi:DUF262 domain-containing protein [Exiguobacterium sp. s127]|uniref:DUF262 domain-containing protein n=1 Tax=Exiguobacterium sp. s127 TaxID=2751210 RepID=UPI001BE99505|nr:DUF262 domain-containing protein [Exiguobacterium sp. s127]